MEGHGEDICLHRSLTSVCTHETSYADFIILCFAYFIFVIFKMTFAEAGLLFLSEGIPQTQLSEQLAIAQTVHPAAFELHFPLSVFLFSVVCLGLCLKVVFLYYFVFLTEVAEELGRTASSSSSSVVPYLPRLPLLPSKTRTLKKQGENKENLDGSLDASESLASSSAPGRRGQSRKGP